MDTHVGQHVGILLAKVKWYMLPKGNTSINAEQSLNSILYCFQIVAENNIFICSKEHQTFNLKQIYPNLWVMFIGVCLSTSTEMPL